MPDNALPRCCAPRRDKPGVFGLHIWIRQVNSIVEVSFQDQEIFVFSAFSGLQKKRIFLANLAPECTGGRHRAFGRHRMKNEWKVALFHLQNPASECREEEPIAISTSSLHENFYKNNLTIPKLGHTKGWWLCGPQRSGGAFSVKTVRKYNCAPQASP